MPWAASTITSSTITSSAITTTTIISTNQRGSPMTNGWIEVKWAGQIPRPMSRAFDTGTSPLRSGSLASLHEVHHFLETDGPILIDVHCLEDFLVSRLKPPQQAQMQGMMPRGRGMPKLKNVGPSGRVKAITYCGDTFKVTTVDGNTRDFWERNLRFKTDSSDEGPEKNSPAIVAAGMMGDRASIIFSSPEEISAWIKQAC